MEMNIPIVVYFHICCLNNWMDIVSKLLAEIRASGMYDVVIAIRCGVLCPPENIENTTSTIDKFRKMYPKLEIIGITTDLSLYERYTLNALIRDTTCSEEDFLVCYIHSKGIQFNGTNICVLDWVDYMTYFNIGNFRECLVKLVHDDYDCVGVNFTNFCATHYSGNFWWSRARHIRKLPNTIGPGYFDPEFWIASKQEGAKFCSLFNSNYTDHYINRFEAKRYVFPKSPKMVFKSRYKHYMNIETSVDLNHSSSSVCIYSLYIVYFVNCAINSNYWDWISNQIELVLTNLRPLKVYIVATLRCHADEVDFRERVFATFGNDKVSVDCYFENEFEYRGILKVWELAQFSNTRTDIFLYFHSKGVTHHQSYDQNRNDNYNALLKDVEMVEEVFSIFPDIDKIGYMSGGLGWIWLNFWYARGSYLVQVEKPIKTQRRHYYEHWLGKVPKKNGTLRLLILN